MDYVVESVAKLASDIKKIPSVKLLSGKYDIMRVFSVEYQPFDC